MRKGKVMSKIFGIAIALLLIGAMLGATMLPLAYLGKNQVSAQESVSYIIVHALNREGVEIASILYPSSVEIYDADTLIGYGAHNEETCNKPIAVSPGGHTIKVKFNGMELSQFIDILVGQTEILTFIFARTTASIAFSKSSSGIH
jgi:hypothetical protein